MPAKIISTDERITSLSCDALVSGAHPGDGGFTFGAPARALDEALDGELGAALRGANFTGKPGEVQIVSTLGRLPCAVVVVAGLGPAAAAGTAEVRRAAGAAARRLGERRTIASSLHEGIDGGARAAAEGFLMGAYRFAGYKSEARDVKIERIVMPGADPDEIERGAVAGEAVVFARDLTNEPPDVLTPRALAERAAAAAEAAGIDCDVLDEDVLEQDGYGGLLAVGRGSAEPTFLVRLHYRPAGAGNRTPRVAVVGKGVTYDSGGLTIKPAASMDTMKTDMGGGAAVIAALAALPRLGLPVEVIAYVPCAENMIGPAAMRPGDVIRHYGGRTTEMVNADAEGRLVLADAIARAGEDDPEALVDVATLTGHISVALGGGIAGLFATDDALADEILDASARSGERLWRMPMPDDYVSDLDSDVADAKNSGSRRGGAITAALFLRAFVPGNVPWAHLDIAGTGRFDAANDEGPKGASGFGTRTLISWIERRGNERDR